MFGSDSRVRYVGTVIAIGHAGMVALMIDADVIAIGHAGMAALMIDADVPHIIYPPPIIDADVPHMSAAHNQRRI